MNDIAQEAYFFAERYHRGQKRKYTGDPYLNHCIAVARLVGNKVSDQEIICAAYLHDTLEDTTARYEDLVQNFGVRVARMVGELTDEFTSKQYPLINRRERKLLEKERIATISDDAKLVKWADMTDNLKDISENAPGFAVVYLREKADVMEVILPAIKKYFKE